MADIATTATAAGGASASAGDGKGGVPQPQAPAPRGKHSRHRHHHRRHNSKQHTLVDVDEAVVDDDADDGGGVQGVKAGLEEGSANKEMLSALGELVARAGPASGTAAVEMSIDNSRSQIGMAQLR